MVQAPALEAGLFLARILPKSGALSSRMSRGDDRELSPRSHYALDSG
jgi:hypothetical protein